MSFVVEAHASSRETSSSSSLSGVGAFRFPKKLKYLLAQLESGYLLTSFP